IMYSKNKKENFYVISEGSAKNDKVFPPCRMKKNEVECIFVNNMNCGERSDEQKNFIFIFCFNRSYSRYFCEYEA
ncbi:hypothetical protein, partial [Anoxybacillus ayderensis]|uniref:hypothetical protein n=1 Tax=Anoxybacillus ayderensis TaxID=265546 RepID=UPI001CB9BC7F